MKSAIELLTLCRNSLGGARSLREDINAFLATNGWIDPKDDSPKSREVVLVLTNVGVVVFGWWWNKRWYTKPHGFQEDGIRAWQSLPPVPPVKACNHKWSPDFYEDGDVYGMSCLVCGAFKVRVDEPLPEKKE